MKITKIKKDYCSQLCQIALGIGDLNLHPELFDIMHCARHEFGVIPNITINDRIMTPEYAQKLAEVIGGVSVSIYDYERTCNVIQMLTEAGVKQINIHNMIAKETLESTWDLLRKFKSEPRLQGVKAVVFLSLKKQGRAHDNAGYNQLSVEEFRELWNFVEQSEIPLGFDSCSAVKLTEAMSPEQRERYGNYVEPCESTLYSVYVNVEGKASPCSFIDKTPGWEQGIDVLQAENFIRDVWDHERMEAFRKEVFSCKEQCKACPVFDI